MAKNRVIGANGGIPWRLPDELQLFKRLTMGHHIVMGRKTWESINRLLPGRTTVIVTRQHGYAVPGAIIAASFAEAVTKCSNDEEIFVIGGADLFRAALPAAERIYLTIVDATPNGDTFMPDIDMSEWHMVSSETHAANQTHPYAYQFSVYDRLRA